MKAYVAGALAGTVCRFVFWLCTLLLCSLSGASAADTAATDPSGRLARIKQRGTLVVGVKTDYAPFGMLSAAGVPEGFEHDLAADIAKRLGVELIKMSVTGTNRLQRLEEGSVDLVIATTGDTVERRQIATMVEPNYYASGVTLFMRPEQSIADWSGARGQKVCALHGSYFNRAMAERFLLDLQMFNNARDAKLAVRDKRCIGYLFDNTAIHRDLLFPEWAGYKATLSPSLVTPWALAIASSERGSDFERFLGDTVAQWHRTGFLIERERAWHLPPSQFLSNMHTLWTSTDTQGKALCSRNASGQWPAACRNKVFVNARDELGLRHLGLWWKEYTGMDLSMVYDSYDRKRFLIGLATTMSLMVLCVLGSLAVGVAGAMIAEARIAVLTPLVRWACTAGRMMPPLLVIYMLVFGLGSMLMTSMGIGLSAMVIVVLCLSLYTGSSIMVAFIEACDLLRNTSPQFQLHFENFRQVLPLSSPLVTAALINVCKATMMSSAVAVPDLLSAVTSIMAENGNVTVMMNTLLLTFVLLITSITRALGWVDRKLRKNFS
jgi:polar amino acid transport system substrate-binding protein